MCDFAIDLAELRDEFGPLADTLGAVHAEIVQRFAPFVRHGDDALGIMPEGRASPASSPAPMTRDPRPTRCIHARRNRSIGAEFRADRIAMGVERRDRPIGPRLAAHPGAGGHHFNRAMGRLDGDHAVLGVIGKV
ncbi:MAG: hypothetical protein ACJA1L_001056 [Paracoccaceae bacterium]|jgi:hypothetical protein